MKVQQESFRALITLDPAEPSPAALDPAAGEYPNPTRDLAIGVRPLDNAGAFRYFPAEICWDSGQQRHPGDHAMVTITVTDNQAGAYFDVGQHFTLWSGGDIGHGTVFRRIHTRS
jgi:hypothetical protein